VLTRGEGTLIAVRLRSFHETKSMELRMRWTMQVCTIVGGNTGAYELTNVRQRRSMLGRGWRERRSG
jgi:hypothetical protein